MGEKNRRQKLGLTGARPIIRTSYRNRPNMANPAPGAANDNVVLDPTAMLRLMVGSMTTTPKKVDHDVAEFCKLISSEVSVYLPFTNADARYRPGECHTNVAHRVRAKGGRKMYGWIIWQSPLLIDAEFHSVWEFEGQFYDITPRRNGEAEILFLPDLTRRISKEQDCWAVWMNGFRLNGWTTPPSLRHFATWSPDAVAFAASLGMTCEEVYA